MTDHDKRLSRRHFVGATGAATLAGLAGCSGGGDGGDGSDGSDGGGGNTLEVLHAWTGGDGARAALAEGLRLYDVAGPIRHRMRAVVRMGERRWDVVLDRGQRILLPTRTPIRAFERVIALDQAQDLLGRDVSVVDMRIADRPTIRLNEQAVAELRRVNGEEQEAGDE